MAEEKSKLERILAKIDHVRDYNINEDFTGPEIRALLDAHFIWMRDLDEEHAYELFNEGYITFADWPFENFSPEYQVSLFRDERISAEEFLQKADLESISGELWIELLTHHPECANQADWEEISEIVEVEPFFALLNAQPQLYEYYPLKERLLQASSELWKELLTEHPEFAEIYSLEHFTQEQTDYLLCKQPVLTEKVHWDSGDPPCKIFIHNLHGNLFESRLLVGVFSQSRAKQQAETLQKAFKEAKLPLEIELV